MNATACLTTALCCLMPLPCLADTLYLKNGDKITGEITDISAQNSITMDTSFAQAITIPRKHIARAFNDKGATIDIAPVNVAHLAPKAITQTTTESILGGVWKGRANLGLTMQSGNTERDNTNLDGTLTGRYGDAHRITLKGNQVRETNNDVETEDNWRATGEYDYFFKPKWFLNTVAGYEQDNIEQVDMRARLGLGLGHQFYESDGLNLKVVSGPTYLTEKFSNGREDDSIAARLATDYDQKIFRGMFQLFHSHEFLVPADDTDNFLIDSASGIRMPLGAGIVASAEVQFDWDNDPEPGIQEDDTIYGLKLGYEW
jgi:putative salt-induced outer membrane protein YdiY